MQSMKLVTILRRILNLSGAKVAITATIPSGLYAAEDRDFMKQINFPINNKVRKFVKKHGKEYSGAIGGNIKYSIIPTSLGNAYVVECLTCRKSLNVTNYENW